MILLWLALLTLLRPGIASASAEETERLVAESFAEYHRGDALETGWAEAYDRGVAAAERAIELDPESAEAHYALFCNLGRKTERSGLAAQAFRMGRLRRLLDRTLELDPRHGHAWEARGEMWLELPRLLGGSEARGEEALQRAAELEPRWAKPPLRLAEYYRRKGRLPAALEHARRALGLAGESGNRKLEVEAESLLGSIERDGP